MRIHVSPLELFDEHVAGHQPGRIVSLLNPGTPFPEAHGYGDRHLRVPVHDIEEVIPGHEPPSRPIVENLVRFLEGWDPGTPLYVHCWAGISRSTATAFTAACLHNPGVEEATIMAAMRAASAMAQPNRRIVALADGLLGRNGRMIDALELVTLESPPEFGVLNAPFHIPARFT
jgi:predicted protein tyrosine phosphatase